MKASTTAINYDNGEVKGSITPDVIADLPLIVSGNQRSAASFIVLLPGVNTGGGSDPFDARINGGIQGGDEAVLDGVTMQEGVQSQSGMVAMYNDYPITPESVSEVSVSSLHCAAWWMRWSWPRPTRTILPAHGARW